MNPKEREDLKERLIEAYRKYHHKSEVIKGYANNISTYVDNPFYVQLEENFEFDPDIKFKISREWFKELYKTNKGRSPKFINHVEAYITIANKRYENEEQAKQKDDNLESSKKLKDVPFSTVQQSSSEIQFKNTVETFNSRINHEFKYIRLSVVGFKMPIKHFVTRPLFKTDKTLQDTLVKLEEEKDRINQCAVLDKEAFVQNQKKIRRIEELLAKRHNIMDIIHLDKDVFIEAPAGNGKSTLLRWLTYQFTSKNSLYFPIFIELMYNKSDDLMNMVKNWLNDYGLTDEVFKNCKPLLLLDGFDQFTGDQTILFDDIGRLKRRYSAQIVFSGRAQIHTSKHQLDLVTYNLKGLSEKNIKNIFEAYLGNKQGLFYFNYILKKDLIDQIEKPLYLTFLLAYIRDKLREGVLDISHIIPTIINKGKLLQNLVVERFIKTYEKEDGIDVLEWQELKNNQIELLSFLAYQMTYELENIEVIELSNAETILQEWINRHRKYQKLNPEALIKAFIKHNILCLKEQWLSFDKKELRLFFTGYHLKDSIGSYKIFSAYKNRLKNEDTWGSIENYLIGFMDADSIFKSHEKIDFNLPILIHKEIIYKYKLALKFINQKNYPKTNDFLNESYLLRLNNMFVSKLLKAKKDTTVDYFISWKPHLRNLLVRLRLFNNKGIPRLMETDLNRRFFKFESIGQYYSFKAHYFINDLRYYDLGQSLSEILNIVSPLDKDIFDHKRYFYDDLLRNKNGFSITTEDRIKMVRDYIFNRQASEFPKYFLQYRSSGKYMFMIKSLQNYSSEFINAFFEKYPEVLPFTFKRYKLFRRRHSRIWYKFDSKKIKPENRDKFINFLTPLFLTTKMHTTEFSDLKYVFDLALDEPLKNPLLDLFSEVVVTNSHTKDEKIKAYLFLFSSRRAADIELIRHLIRDKKNPLREPYLEVLEKYFPRNYKRKDFPYSDAFIDLIIEMLTNINVPIKLKTSILSHIAYTNSKLNSVVIDILRADLSGEMASYCYLFLEYFKVQEAIGPLQDILTIRNDTLAFDTLTDIEPSLYTVYIGRFAEQYKTMMKFLEDLITKRIKTCENYELLECLYIGDRDTLRLLKDLYEKSERDMSYGIDVVFLFKILNSLSDKLDSLGI